MSRIDELRLAIDHAAGGDPWHGPSLAALLADVDAEAASARPIPGVRSIWEVVLHLTAWTREVVRRLDGHPPSPPEGGDWPAIPEGAGAPAWDAARDGLAEAHRRLSTALASFPEGRLGDVVGTTRDQPLGTGVTFAAMVDGLAQHDAYHGGQLAVLWSAVRAGRA